MKPAGHFWFDFAQYMEEFQCFLGVFPLQFRSKQLDTPHIFSKWMCTYFKNKIPPIALLIRCYNHTKESHPVRPEKIDKLLPICRPKPVRGDTRGPEGCAFNSAVECCWVNVRDFNSKDALTVRFNQISWANLGGTAALMRMPMVVTSTLYAQYEWAIFRSMEASIREGSRALFSLLPEQFFLSPYFCVSKKAVRFAFWWYHCSISCL